MNPSGTSKPLRFMPPIQLSLPLLAQGLFCYSTSCALVDDCTLPQLFGCVKYFLKLFEKVLFTVLGIFLWIPEPLFELVDRLSLSTRLSYYCYSRLSILFLKIFLFTRLRKPANPHKYRLFGMKKSFFVKNYFLLKRKIKVVRSRQIAYIV